MDTGGISGTTVLVLGVLAWAVFKGRGGGDRALVRALRKGQGGGLLRGTLKLVGGLLRFTGRFLSGRELSGKPKSTATFLKSGSKLTAAPAAALGSVAFAPPRVSLVKPRRRQPSPWASKAAGWLQGYRGRGAVALDRTARALAALARATVAVYRALRTAYRVVAPVVTTLARAAGAWACWPYAARAAVRVVVLAAWVGLSVPAWRPLTLVLLVLVLLVVVGVAVARRPKPATDDVVYGERLWTLLRTDLKIPDDELRENWLQLPKRLADPAARIVVRLPWTWRGSDLEKETLSALINSRVPGEWQGRVTFLGEHATATFTHKPPPRPPAPEPTPPDLVDLAEPRIREALAALRPEEFLMGVDENDDLIIRKMSGELSHWAFSVGSGGGKSTTLQWLAVQMLMKRGTIVGIDPKLISLKPLEGVVGVHLYKDPDNALDMRYGLEWAADVTAARFYEIEQGTETEFPPLYVFLEETNELSGLLRAVWNRIRIKSGEDKEQAGDPIWEDVVAYMLRFGRAANVHLIAVFQDFKDNTFGGTSLQPLFRLKVLGNYDVRQWERITGLSKAVMPPNVEKAGRMAMVSEGKPITYQTPYLFVPTDDGKKRPATEIESIDLYHQYYLDLRYRFPYSDRGLYAAPPAVSPRGVPRLLQGRADLLSRDEALYGPNETPEGGADDETAGRLSQQDGSVTLLGGSVTARRDGLRLIPGQGGHGPAQDPTAPPELLTLAEIARRLEADPTVPKADAMRQHKARRDDFPRPTEKDGKELYTESQIIAYYAPQEKKA
ncbi:hypothetical protein [Streptomyces niveus]|uniref:hypothetical protein n=1 Tax=Streptomyces niveus TaxID=193462 RepID=UPI0003C59D17|nr:hypothetical protein [Streptomyces niveus]EST17856.1 hypothetical protein M877_40065 [Streptomyces niveus NCIMB 11891]